MGHTVMIVDDSPSLRTVVNVTLSEAGFTVLEASDGIEALEQLEGRRVSLVICDLHMPRLNGLNFLNEIRNTPENRYTPVIMLTTESAPMRREQARAAGAKAWIVKPFSPPGLLDAVAKLIPA